MDSNSIRIRALHQQISDDMVYMKMLNRSLKRMDLSDVNKSHDEISDKQKRQAYQMSMSVLGTSVKLISGLTNKRELWQSQLSVILDSVGEGLSQLGNLSTKYTEGDISKIQGKLEVMRDYLSDDNKRDSEVEQMLRELNNMLESAIEKAHRQIDSPFIPG